MEANQVLLDVYDYKSLLHFKWNVEHEDEFRTLKKNNNECYELIESQKKQIDSLTFKIGELSNNRKKKQSFFKRIFKR